VRFDFERKNTIESSRTTIAFDEFKILKFSGSTD
jgi:hypothetical protein